MKKRAIACWQVNFFSLPGPGMPRLVHEDREITQEQALAFRFNIMSIPTLVLFKNGEEQARISGAIDLQRLLAWTRQHL